MNSIQLLTEAKGHNADYMENGILQYSLNGNDWIEISRVNSATVILENLKLECRYIRCVCEKAQSHWLTVVEFNAYT